MIRSIMPDLNIKLILGEYEMKRLMSVIFLSISFILAGVSYAQQQDVIIGEILELDAKNIQLKSCSYEVGMVLVDIGMGQAPVMGRMSDLKEGSLVKVYVKDRSGKNFGTAEKVIVYKGKTQSDLKKFLNEK